MKQISFPLIALHFPLNLHFLYLMVDVYYVLFLPVLHCLVQNIYYGVFVSMIRTKRDRYDNSIKDKD